MRCRFLNPYLECIGAYASESEAQADGVLPSQYPLVLSLAEYCELVWRVRKLKLTVSLTESGPEGSGPYVGNGEYEFGVRDGTNYFLSEAGVVLSSATAGTHPVREDALCAPPYGTTLTVGTFARGTVTQVLWGGECVFIDNQVRLFLAFSAVRSVSVGQGVSSVHDEFTTGGSGVSFTVMGRTVPLWELRRFGDAGWSYAGSVELEAVEWWPYAQADGSLPIVDPASGVKLRDHRVG